VGQVVSSVSEGASSVLDMLQRFGYQMSYIIASSPRFG